jgi:hypothetical protein
VGIFTSKPKFRALIEGEDHSEAADLLLRTCTATTRYPPTARVL